MADNPNPSRITDASWRFMQALLAMEPGTENSGIHVNKPGFHGTRNENIARSGVGGNYSIRHPLDLLGPADKAAAYDWTHRPAQSGDYRSMAKYGDRLEAAFLARDPRLYGWHEAQGQTDVDATPEELNFDDWTRGTPSSSHAWHWHFSEHRAFVALWDNKLCMLSILRGQSLADYLAGGGNLMTGDDDMSWDEKLQLPAQEFPELLGQKEETARLVLAWAAARIRRQEVQMADLMAKVDALTLGTPVAVDVAVVPALVAALRPELDGAAERAVRKVLGELDNAPPKTTT